MEIDDELDKDKPGVDDLHQQIIPDNKAIDPRQNIVETEGDPWTGSQQVDRVSHPEDRMQGPTSENQTSAGCKISNDAHGCLGGCLILLLLVSLMNRDFEWISIIYEESEVDAKSSSQNFLKEIHVSGVIDIRGSENFYANEQISGKVETCEIL